MVILQRSGEAGRVGPARARVGGVLVLPGALIEEHPHRLPEYVPVNLIVDLERVRAHAAIDPRRGSVR